MKKFLAPFTAVAIAAVIFNGIGLQTVDAPLVEERAAPSIPQAQEITAEEPRIVSAPPQETAPAQSAPIALSLPVAHADEASHTPPVRLRIPSIGVDSPVVEVGVNEKGEMDVPSGKTKNVGWYERGTIPGEMGSAVMDAHVYAAFRKLRNLKIGGDIYVTTRNGEKLHFKVKESMLYSYDQVPPYYLFERNDGKRLNLITCAGTWSKKLGTYTERLVVYAVLVEN